MDKNIIMLIAVISMSAAVIRAQEPVTVTGSFTHNIERLSKLDASRIFIREQARVYVTSSVGHDSNIYALELDEESYRRTERKFIGVVFVNNIAGLYYDLHHGPVTLEVYSLGRGLFYCKDYAPKDASNAITKQKNDWMEKEAAHFLEHAAPGDTLKFYQKSMIDSRHTRQLVTNLSNDNVVYEEQMVHGDGYRMVPVRFLGIKIREKREPAGYSYSYSESIRMSEIAREKLEEIFRQGYWGFICPEPGASAEEWQAWLDDLLNRGYTTPVE